MPRSKNHAQIIKELKKGVYENEMHLRTLSASEAVYISRADPFYVDGMILSGLTSISLPVARELARFHGSLLHLNGLQSITPQVASALAGFAGENLSLCALKTLSSATAKYLAGFGGRYLSFNGIEHISDAVAANLSAFTGEILMYNLRTVTPVIAHMLIRHAKYNLYFYKCSRYSDETLTILASWKGDCLTLFGMQELTSGQAAILATAKAKHLYLSVRSLSNESARALSTYKGKEICFKNIKRLSPELKKAFVAYKGKVLLNEDIQVGL